MASAQSKRAARLTAGNNAPDTSDKALAYHFGAREVGTDAVSGKAIWAPHVIWEAKYVEVTASEAMQAASENKSPGTRDEAKKFPLAILGNGPVRSL